jgi:uncharacterized protein YbaP (TraB family)
VRNSIRNLRLFLTATLAACAAFLLVPSLRAQAPAPSENQESLQRSRRATAGGGGQASQISNPFLWAITSPGAKTSFVFGTIHLARPIVTDFPITVVNAMKSADAVFTEIPMDPGTLLSATQKLLMPGGQTLSTILPPDLLADVQAELRSINPALNLKPFDRFQVWALVATLSVLEDQLKEAGKPAQDSLIFQRAAMAYKEVGGLETMDEQLAIFGDLARDRQIAILRETVTQLRKFRLQGESPIDELVALYVAGNSDEIAAFTEKWMRAGDDAALNTELMERLVYQRNERMAERIAEKIRQHPQKSYFFAVGAAHLYGPRGLVSLLEKSGFTLERVPPVTSR